MADPSTREALPERLGIVERHRRFFDRLLGMLEEAGMLESRDGKWKLLPSPTVRRSEATLRKNCLREYPECQNRVGVAQPLRRTTGGRTDGSLRSAATAVFRKVIRLLPRIYIAMRRL